MQNMDKKQEQENIQEVPSSKNEQGLTQEELIALKEKLNKLNKNEEKDLENSLTKQMEDLDEEEIDELKRKLDKLKKEKIKQKEENRVYTDEELRDRFDYLIYRERALYRRTIIPFVFISLVCAAFIVCWLVLGNETLLYGFGFAFIFFAGILYYMISERKEIKSLVNGRENPREHLDLIFEEKKWYQIEFENMSEEEQKEALDHVRSYSKIFGRYRDGKSNKNK